MATPRRLVADPRYCRIDIRHSVGHHRAMAKDRMKKLTVLVPEDLLRKATEATRAGATPTVRMGLRLLAARRAYDRLLSLQGKVKFSLTWQEMRGEE